MKTLQESTPVRQQERIFMKNRSPIDQDTGGRVGEALERRRLCDAGNEPQPLGNLDPRYQRGFPITWNHGRNLKGSRPRPSVWLTFLKSSCL